jgi:hypothetical protein
MYALDYRPVLPIISATRRDLKLLREENELVTVRVCDFRSTVVACHGIAAMENPPNIPFDVNSAYGKLYRPPIQDLPGPRTINSSFKSEATEQLFKDIYQGKNLVLSWAHRFGNSGLLERGIPIHELIIVLQMVQPDGSLLDIGYLEIVPECVSKEETEKFHHRSNISWSDPRFSKSLLDDSQIDALCDRLVLILLRLVGLGMGTCNFHTHLSALAYSYFPHDRWKEGLDNTMVCIDLLALSPHSKFFGGELDHVANCLEACGKFREAAEIYGQAADCASEACKADGRRFKPADSYLSESTWREVHARSNQGVAYFNAKQWQDAEETFLRAIRFLLGCLPFNDAFEEGSFIFMMRKFDELYQAWLCELPDGKAAEEINEVAQLLHAAVHVAFIKAVGIIVIADKWTRSPVTLKKAFKQAFLSGSVESFRATVRSWKRPNMKIPMQRDPDVNFHKTARNKTKETVRRKLVNRLSDIPPNGYCDNPGCDKVEQGKADRKKLFQCQQCTMAYYW